MGQSIDNAAKQFLLLQNATIGADVIVSNQMSTVLLLLAHYSSEDNIIEKKALYHSWGRGNFGSDVLEQMQGTSFA